METIKRTWQKNTYLRGKFSLRNADENWACPIDFPTVFVAKGRAIRSGNWDSCTGINTPQFVIKNYFDGIGNGKHHSLNQLWGYCEKLEKITWKDVNSDVEKVKALISLANQELDKLETF